MNEHPMIESLFGHLQALWGHAGSATVVMLRVTLIVLAGWLLASVLQRAIRAFRVRIAARLDDQYEFVAGALSSTPEKAQRSGRAMLITGMLVLGELGVSVAPILGAAGVVGLAVGFGAQVPQLPGGAAGLDLVADLHRGGADPGRIHGHRVTGHQAREAPGRERRGDHGGDPLRAAQNLFGLLSPCLPLLGQGAGFVFGVAGFQGGLLGELDGFHHARWAAVVVLEGGGQLAAAGLDGGPAGRPALVQGRVDPDHLTDRAFPGLGASTLREGQAEPGA